jgi:hypothetical protein
VALATLGFLPAAADAQERFVHRPHFIHERQSIPDRKPSYETYYLRKYGSLPPFSRPQLAPFEPTMPPGFWLNDIYVPGYGFGAGAPPARAAR